MTSASKIKKKSYRELKADPVIRVPALAWLLDRKMVYISVAAVGSLAAGAFVYQGWKAYGEIIAPVEVESPYLSLDPAQSSGSIWAAEFISAPRGIDGWESQSSTQPSHGFLQDMTGNAAGEVPMTLLATRMASAGPVKAVAQIYGAGQARKQFDHYVSKLSAKGAVDSRQLDDSGVYGASFEHGFLLVAGDAIVGMQTADNEQRDRLYGEYFSELKESLPLSGCADISGSDTSKRSVYFDPNSFEGLIESVTVEPEVNTNYLPTVQALGTREISNPYASVPEGPLPSSLPALPSEVAKPTVANAPEAVGSFAEVASYRIQDPVGPGCGWSWSAQNALEYDEADLKATQDETMAKTQNSVNTNAQGYVDQKISWARVVALVAPKLDSWNRYVDSVNSVHGGWAKLVADREALRPAWDQYLAAHEAWSTFDARKAAADTAYNQALTQCIADRKTHDDWEREWGPEALKQKQDAWAKEQNMNPSPTATPVPTSTPTPMPTAPPEPVDCTVDPERPSILDEQKPAEPSAPAIPSDVTIPSSWPQP